MSRAAYHLASAVASHTCTLRNELSFYHSEDRSEKSKVPNSKQSQDAFIMFYSGAGIFSFCFANTNQGIYKNVELTLLHLHFKLSCTYVLLLLPAVFFICQLSVYKTTLNSYKIQRNFWAGQLNKCGCENKEAFYLPPFRGWGQLPLRRTLVRSNYEWAFIAAKTALQIK